MFSRKQDEISKWKFFSFLDFRAGGGGCIMGKLGSGGGRSPGKEEQKKKFLFYFFPLAFKHYGLMYSLF
jgi:hypothetical protein